MRIIMKKNNKALYAALIILLTLFTYAPLAAHAAVNPPGFTVAQEFTTSVESADSTFTYILKPLKPGNPMPPGSTEEGYTFTLTGNGSKYIGPLNYALSNIYRYELYQVISAEEPNYTYDKRVFTIEMYAGAENGGAEFVILNEDGEKTSTIVFKNDFNCPSLMVDPPVKKIVNGNPDKASTFEFRLTAQNASQPMPEGSVNGVKTIYVVGSGEGEFGNWYYTDAGVYRYTVQEVNTKESGYTYDTTVYTITDTVTYKNGALELVRVVTNERNEQVTLMTYTNEYDSGPGGGHEGGKGNEGGKGGFLPRTWDEMNIPLFVTLLTLCAATATILTLYLIKKRKKNEK